MQHYYFDIFWDGETLADEVGTSHFDDGSAIYYGSVVANRIARCGRSEPVRVLVRDGLGRLLSMVNATNCRSFATQQSRRREIVQRDLARQRSAAE